ncbi:MAG: PAS domain-containing protein [Ferrovibrio sp.]
MSDAATSQPWLQDRRIARLLTLWRAARPKSEKGGPDLLPGRAACDPLTLGAELLPYAALIEATDNATRFRFRLVGSRLAEHAGLDLTGHYIEDLNPNRDYADYVNSLYRLARDTRLPAYSETRYRAPSGRVGLTRRLTCPLAADGRSVDMFVAVQVFETDSGDGDAPTYTYASSFHPGILKAVADAD